MLESGRGVWVPAVLVFMTWHAAQHDLQFIERNKSE